MTFDRFSLGLAVRAVALAVAISMIVLLALYTQAHVTLAIAIAVALVLFAELVRRSRTMSKMLTQVFDEIGFGELHTTFSSGSSKLPEPLCEALNSALARFRAARNTQAQHATLLLAMIEHLPIAIFAIDGTGSVISGNKAARRIERAASLALHQREDAGLSRIVQFSIEGELRSFQETRGTVNISGAPYQLVAFADIGGELAHAEMKAYRDMSRLLAHELGNSLTPIASLAETMMSRLADVMKDETHVGVLEDIEEGVRTIAGRTRGLIRFSNTVRELLKFGVPQKRRIEVSSWLGGLSQLVTAELSERRTSLVSRVTPGDLIIEADPDLLDQVILNLIRNSLNALDGIDKGVITIQAQARGDGYVEIEVGDNGPGIPSEAVDKIFVPFFSTRKNGAGIGLSIVREIVHAHGGRLHLKPGDGKGARFAVILPGKQYNKISMSY